jgi:translation initiation factor 2 beta subunit (eIF-2beta)/eIF-5
MSGNDASPTPSERFKNNLLVFLEFFEEMFDEAKEENIIVERFSLFIPAKVIISKTKGVSIVDVFIKRTNQFWDNIHDQDDEKIEEICTNLFQMVQNGNLEDMKQDEDLKGVGGIIGSLSKGHVENFKKVLTGKYQDDGETISIFDEERRENLWQYLKSFVKISLCHIHETRKMGGDGKYKVKFFPDINVKSLAQKWNVKTIPILSEV